MITVQKIGILGTSGAGKTTLGREIARRMQTVFVEVDSIRHKANWVQASSEELRSGIEAHIEGHDRWVIDNLCERELGNFIIDRLDLIVWLDLPLWLKLFRAARRSWRRLRRHEVLWNGNYETWRGSYIGKDSVIGYAFFKHFRHREQIPQKPYASKMVRLRARQEADRWLEETFSVKGLTTGSFD